jgi:HNH endonuclease/NUMOD4 motif
MEWKTIKGFPDYQVSNEGDVRSRRKKDFWLLLKGGIDSDGYHIVLLYPQEGKRVTAKVHRLVANAFIPNTDNKPIINHLNGNKKDNRVENLEWATLSENTKHAIDTELFKTSFQKAERPVVQMNLEGEVIKWYKSAKATERDGFHRPAVRNCCATSTLTHKGYIWCYADSDFEEHFEIVSKRLAGAKTRNKTNIKARKVVKVDPLTDEVLKVYDSLSKASKDGYQHSSISLCCQGLYESHKGFKWRYHSE